MKKTYKVLVIGYCVVVVKDADDEADAMELAMDDIHKGDFETDEARIENEITTPQELGRALKQANHVVEA